ncbi:glutathione S-transferase N-terminal domain-containing protein [Candidatus Woesearchaeota archaeon]|nr:glutathione S-transferase N-terminal domain-containing protein [Candidatus Woesearchaeota archaeon]
MKVTLYTAPACPFCIIAKKYLERNKIKFTEIGISKDKKAKEMMIRKSGQENVPVIDVDGSIIIGYDLKKLKGALKI